MFRNKLWLHQVVLFGMLAIIIMVSVLDGSFIFNVNLLWWMLGVLIGFLFVFFDRFIYYAILKPDETLSLKIKELFGQRKVIGGFRLLLMERYDQKELAMRSALFVVVWIVLAFFTATSVLDYLPRGFVLGIGIHIFFDLIYDYLMDKERLDLWFWQIKRTLEPEEKKWFVILSSMIFLVLAFRL